jgi:hypothetical protein
MTNGVYVHDVAFDTAGIYKLRAVWPGEATVNPAVSNIVTVNVTQPTPTPTPKPATLLEIIAPTVAAVVIVAAVATGLFIWFRRKTARYVPKIKDPLADKAVAKEIDRTQKKLEAFKAKYPELHGINPATSPDQIFYKTRIKKKTK